jgi:hypothetical protein
MVKLPATTSSYKCALGLLLAGRSSQSQRGARQRCSWLTMRASKVQTSLKAGSMVADTAGVDAQTKITAKQLKKLHTNTHPNYR